MKFAKIRDVKSPSRGTSKSSGIDFYVPNGTEEYLAVFAEKNPLCRINEMGCEIPKHCRAFIPSGIKVAVPEGYDLVAHNKGGVAVKKGLIFGAQVVDEDYEGEVFISIINTCDFSVWLEWGEKITQMILREVNYEFPEECTIEELQEIYKQRGSERGEGALGSTGNK